MKDRQDIVAGLVIMLLAIAGIYEARGLPTGVAMLPLWVLGTLFVLSCIMIVRGILNIVPAQNGSKAIPFIVAPKRLAIGIIAMALYIIGIEVIGFYVTTALFIPLSALALGFRNFKLIAITTIGFLGFVYVVFSLIFERVLPVGLTLSLLISALFSTGVERYV